MLIKHHGNGDSNSDLVSSEFEEIQQTLEFEKTVHKAEYKALFKTRPNRWRTGVAVFVNSKKPCPSATHHTSSADQFAVFSACSGFVIVTFFLGMVLTKAGIANVNVQLAINIGLGAWALLCSIIGSVYIDRVNRRFAFSKLRLYGPNSLDLLHR